MGRTAALRTALLVVGVGLLAATLVLCLLPGPIAACGSLLAPMFPLRTAARCPSSQSAYVLPALVAGLSGLAALVAGMIVRPPHRRRRHHR
ncbi:MAG TPA: hypothetical protein VGC94_02975 [Amnibacterium sp.]